MPRDTKAFCVNALVFSRRVTLANYVNVSEITFGFVLFWLRVQPVNQPQGISKQSWKECGKIPPAEEKKRKNLDVRTSNLKEKQNLPWEIVRVNKYYFSVVLNQPNYLLFLKNSKCLTLCDSIHQPPRRDGQVVSQRSSVKEAPSVEGLSEQQESEAASLDVEPSPIYHHHQGADVTAHQSLQTESRVRRTLGIE